MNVGSTINLGRAIAAKAEDRTARYLWQTWAAAENYRNALPCGATTLMGEFHEAYRQLHGTDARKLRAGNDEYLYKNFARLKISVVLAFLNKVGFDESGLPFGIEPSPIPDLSDADKATAINRAIMKLVGRSEQLTMGLESPETLLTRMGSEDPVEKFEAHLETAGVRDVLENYVDAVMYEMREDQKETAKKRADRMMELIEDQLKEGRFNDSLEQFKLDFLTYPYAAVEGPIPVAKYEPVWRNGKLVSEAKILPVFRTVRPWDVVWSADSTSTQDGTYMMVRKQYTREELIMMTQVTDAGYFSTAVNDILEVIAILEDPDNRNKFAEYIEKHPIGVRADLYQVPNGASIEGITYYGKLSGFKLKDLGFVVNSSNKELVTHELYETEITIVAGRVVKALIYDNPNSIPRPINTASVQGKAYGMYGDSYLAGFRSLERAYNDKLIWEHTNDYATSVDLYEVDAKRLTKDNLQEIGKRQKEGKTFVFRPGTVVTGQNESYMQQGSSKIITPHKLADPHPNRRMSLVAISNEIDRVSGVPASMHGEASSSGMMRSFKTVFLLEGNASSILTNMAAQIDRDLYAPVAKALNIYNLIHSEDPTIKGDVNIIAGGVKGAVEKEVESERIREDGMVIVQAMGMAQHIESPEARARVEAYATLGLEAMLTTTGVDREAAEHMAARILEDLMLRQQAELEQQQAMQAQAEQQGTGVPVSGPPVEEEPQQQEVTQ